MRQSGNSERASGNGSIAVAGARVASTPSVSRAVLLSHTSRCRTMRNGRIVDAGAQVASTPSVSRAVFLSHTSRCRTMHNGSIAVAGAQVASAPSVSRAVFLSHTSRCGTMRKWPTPTDATGPTCNEGASGGTAQSASISISKFRIANAAFARLLLYLHGHYHIFVRAWPVFRPYSRSGSVRASRSRPDPEDGGFNKLGDTALHSAA